MSTERPLVLVPFLIPTGKWLGEEEMDRLKELQEVGDVWLFEQERFDRRPARFVSRLFYDSRRLSTWGAYRAIYPEVCKELRKGQSGRAVVHDISLPTFSAESVMNVADMIGAGTVVDDFTVEHVVGCRPDIAASLHAEPMIGRSRALLECFFTVLAILEANLNLKPHFNCDWYATEDGFSGLQAFSVERYLTWDDWGWLDLTNNWGEALVGQIQSLKKNFYVQSVILEESPQRNWATTLGVSHSEIMVRMLDQVRSLPELQSPSAENVQRALAVTPDMFKRQRWLTPETFADEVRDLLVYYNKYTKFEPYCAEFIAD